jgi:hypothetical protein
MTIKAKKSEQQVQAVWSAGENSSAMAELAAKRGVTLAQPAAAAPVSALELPDAPGGGWMSRLMPGAATMLRRLRASLGPDLFEGAVANLKLGEGYIFDEAAGLAIGNPPASKFVLGRAQMQDGFTVRRVKLHAAATDTHPPGGVV